MNPKLQHPSGQDKDSNQYNYVENDSDNTHSHGPLPVVTICIRNVHHSSLKGAFSRSMHLPDILSCVFVNGSLDHSDGILPPLDQSLDALNSLW